MKRITADSLKQSNLFFHQLMGLYSQICQKLQRLSFFFKKKPKDILALEDNLFISQPLDRKVRKQNQLQLFRSTRDLIAKYVTNKKGIKKSEILMKFSSVSQVLKSRVLEQMNIKPGVKQQILSNIESNRKQVLEQFQRSKKIIENAQQLFVAKKQTDQYVLKYVCTDTTRPNTANISRIANSATPSHLKTAKSGDIVNTVDQSYFINNIEFSESNVKRRQERKTTNVPVNHSRNDSMKSRYRTTFRPTDERKVNNYLISQMESEITNDFENKQKQVNQSIESDFSRAVARRPTYKKKTNLIKREQPRQSIEYVELQEQKKSNYYLSQNYIKSKKNLDNVSLFTNKLKHKNSVCMEMSGEEVSENDEQNIEIVPEPTQGYRSRKFFTKKYIPQDEIQIDVTARSEKYIQKKSNFISKESLIPRHIKQSFLKPNRSLIKRETFQKISQKEDIVEMPKEKSLSKIGGEELFQINDDRIYLRHTSGKSLGYFYDELTEIRRDLHKYTHIEAENFSIFFQQQSILEQEQNRRIQKILAERRNDCYVNEFEMYTRVSKREVNWGAQFHEDSYFVGLRKHLKQIMPLGQTGPIMI